MTDKLRVIYVDDQPDLLEFGKMFLEEFDDYTVTITTSVTEALNLIFYASFDIIISDYEMPIINGIQFLNKLKAAGNTTPFILFTGRGREEIVIQAINSGADFYVQKGGDPDAQFAELSNNIKSAVKRKRAEDALRASETRYRTIINTTVDGFWLVDANTEMIIDVNDTYCKMVGYTREEILKKRVADFDVNELPADVANRITRIIVTGYEIFETYHKCKNGTSIPLEISVTYHPGNNSMFICFGRDITKRLQRKEELSATREQLMATEQMLVDTANKLKALGVEY